MVAEVAVVGIKHEIESQWPRAYVKVKDGKCVTEEELKKYVSGLKV
jgi:acyl-coenzyme A synthetase/AMP-(fatty) acid ligase